jgi:oligoendopeptidase F
MLISFSPMSFSQDHFQAIPPEIAAQYHFDLSKSFYSSEDAFQKDLQEAQKLAEETQPYRGKVVSSGPGLFALVQKLERLSLLTQKMYVYRYLAYAVNTKLEPQLSATTRSVSDISAKTAFVNTELRQLSESDLDRLIQQEPKLGLYRFFLLQNTRYKPHTLSSDKEEMLSVLYPELFSWQPQAFQKLIDRTKFSEIKTDGGTFNVYRDREVLRKDPNRKIREEATLKLYDEYSASADLYGFILIKQSDAYNATASTRNFKDAFDSSLFDAYLTKEQADAFFSEIGKYAPLMQRYTKIRKDRIKALWNYEIVEPWDMDVVPPDFKRPLFTIGQTTDVLNKSLAFHGPQYSEDL